MNNFLSFYQLVTPVEESAVREKIVRNNRPNNPIPTNEADQHRYIWCQLRYGGKAVLTSGTFPMFGTVAAVFRVTVA